MNTEQSWKKTAVLFLSSQTISLFGSLLVQYAILWHITLNAQSGVMLTLMIVIGFLPTFFLAPFAGVWADRHDRKKLIAISDAIIALTTLALAGFFAMGFDGYWPLFVASFIRSIGQGIQQPAVGAFIPQFVPRDRLTKVNGLFTSIQSASMLVAPILAGALMTLAPIQSIFYIDVITGFGAVLILLFFIRVPAHAKALSAEKTHYFADMKAGFAYIRTHAYLIRFFIFSALFLFLVAPLAFLTPLQVTRSFGEDVWRLTAIEIVFSVGMSLGGVLISAWGGFKNRIHTMTLATVAIGVLTVSLGLVPVFWIYLVFMGIAGITMPLFNTPAAVLIQEHVEESYMGRVFSVMSMISSSMMPLGMLVFGPVADVVSIEVLLIGTGIGMAAVGAALLSSRVLIAAGRPRSVPDSNADHGPDPGTTSDSHPDPAAAIDEPTESASSPDTAPAELVGEPE